MARATRTRCLDAGLNDSALLSIGDGIPHFSFSNLIQIEELGAALRDGGEHLEKVCEVRTGQPRWGVSVPSLFRPENVVNLLMLVHCIH